MKPNTLIFVDFPSDDVEACARFYGEVFGWTVEAMDMPVGKYYVAKVGEVAVGGMASCPEGAPAMPPAWGCYVTVANVDETLRRCESLGGKVLMPAMDVPTVGRMACIQDPQGATISVISYFPREG